MTIQSRNRLLRSSALLALAAGVLTMSPAQAHADYSTSCEGTRGAVCDEFKFCVGIGVKVCNTTYYYIYP